MRLPARNNEGQYTDAFKRQLVSWRRAYTESGTLRERYPALEALIIEIAFTDVRKIGIYSPQMHSFSTSAKAFFSVACPRTLCLEGGFDVDAVVRDLLHSGGDTMAGTLECQGWLEPAHTEHARCHLQLHYRIQAHYAPVADAGRPRRPATRLAD